ncbi:hypothetical protein E4U55_004631 [Claviceps digitariae]|nr:hypothetical protein E4U55_004631 [Claviceps digitariae]
MKQFALAAKESLSDISYEDIFRYPRLEDMARRASDSWLNRGNVHALPYKPGRNRSGIWPFSLSAYGRLLINMATRQYGIKEEAIEDIYPCSPLQLEIQSMTRRRPDEVEELVTADMAAAAIPYSQTKFVAKSPINSVVNADDYIWRLISACVKVGMYNADAAVA